MWSTLSTIHKHNVKAVKQLRASKGSGEASNGSNIIGTVVMKGFWAPGNSWKWSRLNFETWEMQNQQDKSIWHGRIIPIGYR